VVDWEEARAVAVTAAERVGEARVAARAEVEMAEE